MDSLSIFSSQNREKRLNPFYRADKKTNCLGINKYDNTIVNMRSELTHYYLGDTVKVGIFVNNYGSTAAIKDYKFEFIRTITAKGRQN